MFKTLSVTVPAGTAADDPVNESILLCEGTLTTIVIRPAPGPQWEVFCKIEYRETSVFPFEEAEWIPLERFPVTILPNWNRWDGTYEIEVIACSPDARFSHTFMVDFNVEEEMTTAQAIQDLIARGF